MSSYTYLARPRHGQRPPSDVVVGSEWSTAVGVGQCLQTKGYCLINDLISESAACAAQDACADEVEWRCPAPLVQEGLLGPEGSCRIAGMSPEEDSEGEVLEAFQAIDYEMGRLCSAVHATQDLCGFRCSSRSLGYLHEVGGVELEDAELTDADAHDFAGLFATRKVMVLILLGPAAGLLDLQPYDEDAPGVELLVAPGAAVIVRTDQLSCALSAPGGRDRCYAATCYLLQPDILKMHRERMQEHLTPAALSLDAWVEERLREIKEAEPAEQDWEDITVPRSFAYAANRTWFTRQQTVVAGASTRMPATWEHELTFLSCVAGADLATDIPFMRWDHSTVFDEDPEGWKKDEPKTDCRHACFMDGLELFDSKFFGISTGEVKSMDPCQRLCLETTYDSLYRSGYRKKDIHGSSCGMYVGIGYTDWELAERTMDFGSFGATGSSPAVCAGRLSFCLGCRGASVAIDAEAASALACTYWAAESVEAKGNGKHQEMSCALGTHLLMAKHWWPALSASGFLCSKGRCFSFDSAASGYIQGEGVGTLTVRAKKMDGEAEKDFDHISIGTISGGAIGNSGQSAGLYAPHGPGEQQVLTDSCRRSGITPQDVDAVECASTGMLLRDAVEVASCAKALRGCGADEGMPWSGSEPEMLQLGSAKTNTGNLIETSGLVGLIKVFHAIRWNLWPPSQHLRRLNPHMDVSEAPIIMGGECTDPRSRALFMGHSAFGFGGTNVHLHAFGGVDEEVRRPPGPVPESRKPRLTFWPAGGGESARPRKGYFIIGTWGGPDAEPVQMEQEGVGVYGYTMALGENRWEQFQLMLDADEGKVLHPRHCEAWKGCEVLGPDPQEVAEGLAWLIDGRSALPEPPPGEEELVLAEAGTLTETNEDVGVPGDLYRIRLHTAGKWRTVSWARLPGGRRDQPAEAA